MKRFFVAVLLGTALSASPVLASDGDPLEPVAGVLQQPEAQPNTKVFDGDAFHETATAEVVDSHVKAFNTHVVAALKAWRAVDSEVKDSTRGKSVAATLKQRVAWASKLRKAYRARQQVSRND